MLEKEEKEGIFKKSKNCEKGGIYYGNYQIIGKQNGI